MNSVRVGGLFYKPGTVHEVLGKSVRLVAHEHRYEEETTFGQQGSCTLISHRQRAFVITTRHQLSLAKGNVPAEGHFETLRFATNQDGRLANILVDRCFHEDGNPDQEYHDLVFFGVHQPWLINSADRPYFFPLEGFVHEDRVVSFFYGHPMSRTEFQYEPNHAHVGQAYIDGQLDAQFVSHAEYYRRYSYAKLEYEMNGFSGGAVFSLLGSLDEGLRIAFDGIIVRAGGGHLYAVDADYLRRALDTFADGVS